MKRAAVATKTARFVRDVGWQGDASLYKLSEPVEYGWDCRGVTSFVIVSAVNNQYAHETYIFPATADGCALSMLEMTGSFQGDMDHARALRGLGFEVSL